MKKKTAALMIFSVIAIAVILNVLIFFVVFDLTGSNHDVNDDNDDDDDDENSLSVQYKIFVENKWENTKTLRIDILNETKTIWYLSVDIGGLENHTFTEKLMKYGKYYYRLEHPIPGYDCFSEGSFIIEKGHTHLYITLTKTSAHVVSTAL